MSRKSEYQRTLVRRGASIGANATVVCGATIGEYAFIGAGAVVRGGSALRGDGRSAGSAGGLDVPVWNRAHVDRGPADCPGCGSRYREEEGRLRAVDPSR